MVRVLTQAGLTGAFCVAFALVVDAATDRLALGAFLAFSFASGFLGSLFAQAVVRRGGADVARGGRRDELE